MGNKPCTNTQYISRSHIPLVSIKICRHCQAMQRKILLWYPVHISEKNRTENGINNLHWDLNNMLQFWLQTHLEIRQPKCATTSVTEKVFDHPFIASWPANKAWKSHRCENQMHTSLSSSSFSQLVPTIESAQTHIKLQFWGMPRYVIYIYIICIYIYIYIGIPRFITFIPSSKLQDVQFRWPPSNIFLVQVVTKRRILHRQIHQYIYIYMILMYML